MKLKFQFAFMITLFVGLMSGCSGGELPSSGNTVKPFPTGLAAAISPGISGTNVLPVQVDTVGYLNEPVVSVVICNPGDASSYGTASSSCKVINRVLLDTGSSGLRVFSSVLSSLNLTQVTSTGGEVARCAAFADGTNQWGPVKKADLILGGETVSNLNIQVIDANYATSSTLCPDAVNDPNIEMYNGILGIGVRIEDCSDCVTSSSSGYFVCTNSTGTCQSSTAALVEQVKNPVAAMTLASNTDGVDDSNGTILVMPEVPSTGAVSASGYLVFGIGTRSGGNNSPASGLTVLNTDKNGFLYVDYGAWQNLVGFIDSGSNGLFIPSSAALPTCGKFFCPSLPKTLTATNKPWTLDGTENVVSFQILNGQSIVYSRNYAYSTFGGPPVLPGYFAWGLPFFFGRSVYTGILGKTAIINGVTYGATTPYYAY